MHTVLDSFTFFSIINRNASYHIVMEIIRTKLKLPLIHVSFSSLQFEFKT